MSMNRYIVTDPKACIGCHTCEIACVLSHVGDQVGKFSPEDFTPRIKVIKGDDSSAAVMCRHCDDAPCAVACPNGAIIQEGHSIQIIQSLCIGCKACELACPYGSINVVTQKVIRYQDGEPAGFMYKAQAQKCDLCKGRAKGAACVETCPTSALTIAGGA